MEGGRFHQRQPLGYRLDWLRRAGPAAPHAPAGAAPADSSRAVQGRSSAGPGRGTGGAPAAASSGPGLAGAAVGARHAVDAAGAQGGPHEPGCQAFEIDDYGGRWGSCRLHLALPRLAGHAHAVQLGDSRGMLWGGGVHLTAIPWLHHNLLFVFCLAKGDQGPDPLRFPSAAWKVVQCGWLQRAFTWVPWSAWWSSGGRREGSRSTGRMHCATRSSGPEAMCGP
jgi:hypothetical protein